MCWVRWVSKAMPGTLKSCDESSIPTGRPSFFSATSCTNSSPMTKNPRPTPSTFSTTTGFPTPTRTTRCATAKEKRFSSKATSPTCAVNRIPCWRACKQSGPTSRSTGIRAFPHWIDQIIYPLPQRAHEAKCYPMILSLKTIMKNKTRKILIEIH